MEKDKRRKIVLGVISIIVTIGLLYFITLCKPEKPYWYYFVPLLFLYWTIFIAWYSKHKRKNENESYTKKQFR